MKKPITWISFEHCDRTSGECGIRGRAPNDRDDFTARLFNNPKIRILAVDLTYDTATDLMALTPEICRLTDAVENIFGTGNHIDEERQGYIIPHLFEAYKRIIEDREDRIRTGLVPKDGYLDVFVDANAGTTGKYLVFRKMSSLFKVKPNGTLADPKKAILSLASELISVALEKQIPVWKKERKEYADSNRSK